MTAAKAVTDASAALPSTGPVTSSTIDPVLASVHDILGSTAASLPGNVNAAVASAQALHTTITQCDCGDTLGNLVQSVLDLLNHLLGLQSSCSGGTAPTVPGPASCLHVDASKTVCGILPGVYVGPVVLCGLLGDGLTNTLQGLVNGLGLNAACPTGPPAATVPPATIPPVSVPPVAVPPATVNTTSPAGAGSPSDPDTVIKLAGLCIHLAVTINLAAGSADQSCGGLLGPVNGLVNSILHQPLTGSGGLLGGVLSRRDLGLGGLLGPILGGGGSGDALGLGGLTSGLTPTVNALTPTINSVVSAVDGVGATCAVGGLTALLDTLGTTVNKLVGGLGSCGCGSDPAVTSAISAMQATAASSLPAVPAPAKRAFRSRSRRGHVNFLRAQSDSILAPSLVGPMTSALAFAAAIQSMQSAMSSSVPSCSSMLSSLATLFGSSSTSLSTNLGLAVIETRAFQTSLVDRPDLGKLIEYTQRLLDSLVNMQSATSMTVSSAASCDGANVSHVICGLLPSLWYLGPPILCGLERESTLSEDVQKLVGDGAVPQQCPSNA
ncbi:hypothetical protein B0H17DRAFT_1037873 [Mycena rosella]|uniref:Uncharacterized protein n=1 Tax=Mycena rosella TaxID=1033263 RepID=A0AAD7GUC5_MYCRO|nr:hypothetical protein B0H17DRAFT_1037873 [Mycena rosella]